MKEEFAQFVLETMKATSQTKKSSEQLPLTFALNFINRTLCINELCLESRYGLCRRTLTRIRGGKSPCRQQDKYMFVFVKLLNDERRRYHALYSEHGREPDRGMEQSIDKTMRDLLLIQYNLPTDDEIRGAKS